MSTAVSLALDLCRDLETHGIRYVVAGDVREFPERIRSDLDIVVDPGMLLETKQALRRVFEGRGGRLVQVLQHEQTAWFFVFALHNEGEGIEFIYPDICGNYFRHGRLLLTAEEILNDRARAVGKSGEDLGFYIPRPAMAFIYYLLKRIDKADLGPEQGEYLSSQWRSDPGGSTKQIRRFWGEADTDLILEAAERSGWSSLKPLIPQLRDRLRSGIGWSWSWWIGELDRIQRRLREPTGLWVAFLGSDGSGKSTVIERVRRDLGPAFRRTRVIHLRPSVGRNTTGVGPVTQPHAEPPRPRLVSAAKLGYWLLDYTAGYMVQTRPALTRSTLLLYDRYYPDILADPVRYRYKGSGRLARALMALIPHPDLYVVLDAPPEETHRRKGELPVEEIERQQGAYRALARDLPNAHLINASDSPEIVARKVESLILDHMVERESGRGAQR